MNGILQGLYDFLYTFIYLILIINFISHIILLREWLDNIKKNEALLEMRQFLQINNEKLVVMIKSMERDNINLIDKIQFQRVLRHYLIEFMLLNLIIVIY